MTSKCVAPLARCRVLYIGRAAPMKHPDGLQAAQKPLHELYTKDHSDHRHVDKDANLIAFNSGILMQPLDQPTKKVWLPIKNLEGCFAVKPTELDDMGHQMAYVPVDSPDSAGSQHPPIFACIFRRSDGLPIADCYAFVCKSNMAAMALVQACIQAHSEMDSLPDEMPRDEPPPPPAKPALPKPTNDNGPPAESMTDNCPPEYYEKPPLHGYFYSPRPDLIHKFAVVPHDEAPQPVPPPPQPAAPAPAPPPQTTPANPPAQQMMMVYPLYPEFQYPQEFYPYPDNFDPYAPQDYDDKDGVEVVPVPVPYYYAENGDPTALPNNPPSGLRRYYDDGAPQDPNAETYMRQIPGNNGFVDDRDYMQPMNERTYDRYIPQDSRYCQYPDEGPYSRRLPNVAASDPNQQIPGGLPYGQGDFDDFPNSKQYDGNFILKRPNRPYPGTYGVPG